MRSSTFSRHAIHDTAWPCYAGYLHHRHLQGHHRLDRQEECRGPEMALGGMAQAGWARMAQDRD